MHLFTTANPDSLGRDGPMGTELDIVYQIPLFQHCKLSVGTTLFVPLGDFAEDTNTSHDWSFIELRFDG